MQPTDSLWQLIANSIQVSGGVEKTVLLILAALSALSWALIISKSRMIRRTNQDNDKFVGEFEKAEHTGVALKEGARFPNACIYTIFKLGMETWKAERQRPKTAAVNGDDIPLKTSQSLQEKVLQSMQHASRSEFTRMAKNMDILASIGSCSPFIGLLGTVWGIMATFQALSGAKSASLQVVAPGIASALIATAAGLFVAIPAVVAYNWIMARMDELQERVNCFIERSMLLLQSSGGLDSGENRK